MAGKTPTQTKTARDTLAKVRAHVSDVERRLKSADKNTARSVVALETAFSALKSKVDADETGDLKTHIDELASHLNRRLDESRAQIKGELQSALTNPDIDHVREALSRATARLSQTELRQAESIQKVNAQIIRLATAIDNRVRNETREREALEHRVTRRFETQEAQTEARITGVEDNSAAALRKIGTQVAQLSTDLTQARSAIEHRTEGRIYEAALDSQHEIESLKADINARLETVSSAQPFVDITPVQRSVAALAARLDNLETRIGAGNSGTISANAADSFAPATDQTPPPFVQDVSAPPLPLPIPPAEIQDGPAEFNPSEYETVRYDMAAPQPAPIAAPAATAAQNPYESNPYTDHAGHAEAQMALHDYDAPADFDPYGAPEAPDYAGLQPLMPAGASSGSAYSENPYAQNPYAGGLPATGDPYAPPAYQQAPLDPGADLSMAAARPGGDEKQSRKTRAPKDKSKNPVAGLTAGLTPRTLRTAAGAAALVAVVAAGAWVVKDRLPGGAPQMAASDTINSRPAAAQPERNAAPKMLPVNITAATGKMSSPDGAGDIDPSKPRIDNFASLDAAVAAGNPVAQLQKGLTLLQGGQEKDAAPFIRAAANQGLPAAQYYLGNMYENGQGLPVDAAQARMLTERAARAGHRIAMYDLALYYIEGKGGVQADMSVAAQWFRKAAEFGMTDAQYNLAVLYERGTGVTPDPAEAFSWYAIAGSQGDQDAERRAAQLKSELPAETLKRAQSKVARFRPSEFDPETNGIFKNMPWNQKGRGNSGVATVQRLLLDIGYDAGVADGAMGPKTREAIKAFERANGLPETGRVDDIIIQTLKDVAGA